MRKGKEPGEKGGKGREKEGKSCLSNNFKNSLFFKGGDRGREKERGGKMNRVALLQLIINPHTITYKGLRKKKRKKKKRGEERGT